MSTFKTSAPDAQVRGLAEAPREDPSTSEGLRDQHAARPTSFAPNLFPLGLT